VLFDSAESRKRPTGAEIDDAVIRLHQEAADTMEASLAADIDRNCELVLTTYLEAIDDDKAQLNVTRPLSPPALASLQQRLRLE
jgi:hypothetical protein